MLRGLVGFAQNQSSFISSCNFHTIPVRLQMYVVNESTKTYVLAWERNDVHETEEVRKIYDRYFRSCEFSVLITDSRQNLSQSLGLGSSKPSLRFRPEEDTVTVYFKLGGAAADGNCECDYNRIRIPVLHQYTVSTNLVPNKKIRYVRYATKKELKEGSQERAMKIIPDKYYLERRNGKLVTGEQLLEKRSAKWIWKNRKDLLIIDPLEKYYDRNGKIYTGQEIAALQQLDKKKFDIDMVFSRSNNFWFY